MGEGRYIYGIVKTNEKKSFGTCGINNGEEVYIIPYQDISCVVSKSPLQDYSSMLKETLGHFLVKHQTIIEKIMKEHTIIPMKFGTFVFNDDEVVQVAKRGYPQFKELLGNMDSKIELDVTAAWSDLGTIIMEIGEKDEQIREFKTEIAKRPVNESLQDRIKIGAMIKDALDKRREKEAGHMIGSLRELAIDFQKHQVMDDSMILNCAFLLEKVKEPDFDAKLKELDKEYNHQLNFRCIGPLAPHSFATCQLNKLSYSRIDEARKLLGLEENASLNEVKDSYRQLAQKKHPDVDPNDAQLKEEFGKITQAYKLLANYFQAEDVSFEDRKNGDFIAVEIIRP